MEKTCTYQGKKRITRPKGSFFKRWINEKGKHKHIQIFEEIKPEINLIDRTPKQYLKRYRVKKISNDIEEQLKKIKIL